MKNLLILILSVVLLSSCSKTIVLTSSIKESLGEENVKKLQVYSSQKIVLEKTNANGSIKTVNGNIVVDKTQKSETIIVKRKTKGIIEKVSNDIMIVRFEMGDNKVLPFGLSNTGYSLMAKEWKNKEGVIEYAGNKYKAIETSGSTQLLVKAKQVNSYKKKVRKVSGVSISKI
jgi:hypothetical protein